TRPGGHQDTAGQDGSGHRMFEHIGRRLFPDLAAGEQTDMKPRVLIVEDERTALHALTALLAEEGYDILKAENGQAGLAAALQDEPDLILLDIRLPDLDGLTVLERLRTGFCDASVIIMTADTSSSYAIRATQLGAFDYVSKPINDEHLLVL